MPLLTRIAALGLRRLDELSGHIHEVMSRLNIESRQPESHVGKNTQTGEDSILGQPRLYFDPRLESGTRFKYIPFEIIESLTGFIFFVTRYIPDGHTAY